MRAEIEAARRAKKQAKPKRLRLQPGPYREPENLSAEEKVELRKLLWEDFLKVPKEERAKWELERFQDGIMPPWFFTKKRKLEEKEYEEQKKREKEARKRERMESIMREPKPNGEQ